MGDAGRVLVRIRVGGSGVSVLLGVVWVPCCFRLEWVQLVLTIVGGRVCSARDGGRVTRVSSCPGRTWGSLIVGRRLGLSETSNIQSIAPRPACCRNWNWNWNAAMRCMNAIIPPYSKPYLRHTATCIVL